jgi:hypothetical protein
MLIGTCKEVASQPWRTTVFIVGALMLLPGLVRAQALRPFVEGAVWDALDARGEAQVIVMLAAEPSSSLTGLRPSPEAVAACQERVLAAAGSEFSPTRRLQSAPFMAGKVTTAGLELLMAHPEVVRIGIDEVGEGQLNQARPLVGANQTQAAGFTGAGVTVAVLDTGIDRTHPDLSDDLVGENCFCANNGACCPNGMATQTGAGSAQDDLGHGTWVTGQITSLGTTAPLGMAPDANIVAIKVLDLNNQGLCSDTAAALADVVMNWPQVDIVNMSLGFSPLTNGICDANASACIQMLLSPLQDLFNADVAVFASSGNDGSGTQMRPPACISSVISVGAVYDANVGTNNFPNAMMPQCTDNTTMADQVTCYSNSNAVTDLMAPATCATSTNLGGGQTGCGQGTSASCPQAVGCAALVLDAFPGMSPTDLRNLLVTTGTNVTDSKNGLTFPRINCLAALCDECGTVDIDLMIPAPVQSDCTEPGGVDAQEDVIQDWLAQASATSTCGDVALTNDAMNFFPSCVPGDPEVAADYDINFTATHVCGQVEQDTSTVSIVHIAVPEITPPASLQLECNSPGGVPVGDPQIAAWLASVSGTDSCDDVNAFTNNAPALFESGCPPGMMTNVIFTGTDECGNSGFDTSTVTVVDSTPPELAVQPVEACLWPPNHKYVCFDNVSDIAQFSDVCDDSPTLTITCASNQCDEAPCPEHPGQNSDGNTTNDCVYDATTDTLCARAERAGTDPAGRTYTVTYTATDNCGAETEAIGMTIHVPHDRSSAQGCIKAK